MSIQRRRNLIKQQDSLFTTSNWQKWVITFKRAIKKFRVPLLQSTLLSSPEENRSQNWLYYITMREGVPLVELTIERLIWNKYIVSLKTQRKCSNVNINVMIANEGRKRWQRCHVVSSLNSHAKNLYTTLQELL